MSITIQTPRGQVFQNQNGKAELAWNPGFGPELSGNLNNAQRFIDSEVLRRCSPRVPLRTGMLEKSGQLGTEVGSGEVRYTAPYARAQYYRNGSVGSATGSLRGPKWFERMKNADGADILAGAAKMAGGEAKK